MSYTTNIARFSGPTMKMKFQLIFVDFLKALNSVYPEHKWVKSKHFHLGQLRAFHGSKSQNFLLQKIQELFKEFSVSTNYLYPVEESKKIGNDNRRRFYEFDVSFIIEFENY